MLRDEPQFQGNINDMRVSFRNFANSKVSHPHWKTYGKLCLDKNLFLLGDIVNIGRKVWLNASVSLDWWNTSDHIPVKTYLVISVESALWYTVYGKWKKLINTVTMIDAVISFLQAVGYSFVTSLCKFRFDTILPTLTMQREWIVLGKCLNPR